MKFEEIVQTIVNVGLSTTLSVLVIYFLFYYISDKLNIGKHKKKLSTYEDLASHHELFYKIKSYLDISIPLMKIKGPVRSKMFRDMLDIKLNIISDDLKTLLLSKSLNSDNMLQLNLNNLELMVKKYQNAWRSGGVPEIVITKFEEWHQAKILLLYDSIKQICDCQVIDTPVEEMYSILNIYLTIVSFTIVDAEKTLTVLNGQLKGVTYKGEIIE